mmetsp:Transcript_13233/g.31392  ORF Transcript_13233/g.31392 Transcript_13233/m.31392 type:complete len:310 (-) Transcript_13233:304-1233(-)
MLDKFLQCCNTEHDARPGSELKVVELSSDVLDCPVAQPVHLLTRQDSFDATATPRAGLRLGRARALPATPRQRDLAEAIRLPRLRRYPVPPGCSGGDPEDTKRRELLRAYREFVLDLHRGIHMTQLCANQDYSDIHCQVLDDLQTLKVDQGSGCIIEFPLSAVSKVYRIVKNDDNWHSAGSLTGPVPIPPLPLSNAEHIVVIEFMRRKLAFVFNDIAAAQRFLMCIELLIRRVQESQAEATMAAPLSWKNLHPRGSEASAVAPVKSSGAHTAREPQGRFGGKLLPATREQPPVLTGEEQQVCACRPQPI